MSSPAPDKDFVPNYIPIAEESEKVALAGMLLGENPCFLARQHFGLERHRKIYDLIMEFGANVSVIRDHLLQTGRGLELGDTLTEIFHLSRAQIPIRDVLEQLEEYRRQREAQQINEDFSIGKIRFKEYQERTKALMEDIAFADGPAPSLAFRTPAQLAASTPDEIPWIAEPVLAEGSTCAFAGKHKSAGKTTYALAMCSSILRGEDFIGKPTKQSSILYLTEQGDVSFRKELKDAHLLDAPGFEFLSYHLARETKWPDVVDAAIQRAVEMNAKVLIVDTGSQWGGLRGDAENAAGSALEMMSPLQTAAAQHGLGVMVIFHTGRADPVNVSDAVRGSSAFGGGVDIVALLRRPDQRSRMLETRRQLGIIGRFGEIPDFVIELGEDGIYRPLGDASTLVRNETRNTLLKFFDGNKEWSTEEKIIEATDLKRTNAVKTLRELLQEKLIVRTGKGGKGHPFLYAKHSVATESTAATESMNGSASLYEI